MMLKQTENFKKSQANHQVGLENNQWIMRLIKLTPHKKENRKRNTIFLGM